MQQSTDVIPEQPAVRIHPVHTRAAIFESGEHSLLGDKIDLMFDTGPKSAKGLKLNLSPAGGGGLIHPPPHTFGHIVALGGDFFGDPAHPISTSKDPKAQFNAVFEAFRAVAAFEQPQMNALIAFIDGEIKALNEAVRSGKKPSSIYDGGIWSTIRTTDKLQGITNGRYLKLAETNWDHFGIHAEIAYKAGHSSAVDMAIFAKSKKDNSQKSKWLELAYATDAFACHFLTDLFSSGHSRTPRKELYDMPMTASSATGLLAKAMHDEDSLHGLIVASRNGGRWTAYGDKKLLDTEDKTNNERVRQAAQASVDEVWTAFKNGHAPNQYEALNWTPDLRAFKNPTDRTNHSPLFVARNGSVDCRRKVHDMTCYDWTNDWHVPLVLIELGLG